MDLSKIALPAGLRSLTLICDNNTIVKHIENFYLSDVASVRSVREEDEPFESEPDADVEPDATCAVSEKSAGIVVTNKQYEDKVLGLLDTLMEGKTKKDAASVIQAAILAGVILKPTYRQFCYRYGMEVIGKTMYGRYIGTDKETLLKVDMDPIIAEFVKINV